MMDLRLKVDGQLYGGWQEVRIKRSIETIAGSFDISVTERWSGQDTPRPIRPGVACALLIGKQPIITGYVDDVSASYDAGSRTVSVSGRDKTGDLVDCTVAVNFQFPGFTILDIAQRLCQPFGITVTADTDVGRKFSTYAQNPGDSVFNALDGAAKIRGVLLLSDGVGGLIIARAGTQRLPTVLALGDNIKAASATFSHKDRFSEYTATGHQEVQSGDPFYAKTAFHLTAKSVDPVITRHRPLTMRVDKLIDRAQLQERVDWERNVRFGRSQQIQYTVQGWTYDGERTWPINQLVAVKDEFIGIDADLLIVSTAFILDDNGSRTELTLAPREAYDLVPMPEQDLWDKA